MRGLVVAEWVFWAIAAVAVTACLGVVFAPLLRGGGGAARPGQLRHAGPPRPAARDRGRPRARGPERGRGGGDAGRDLAPAARRRRGRGAPRRRRGAAPARVTRLAAPAMIVAALLAAGGLYALLGAPGLPDQPLAARQAREAAARADRPGQAEAEAMVARAGPAPAARRRAEDRRWSRGCRRRWPSRPDDLEGHRLLARSLAALGRWAGGAGGAGAGGGDPRRRRHRRRSRRPRRDARSSPPAATSRRRRRRRWRGRWRSTRRTRSGATIPALTLLQGGRPDLACRIWSGLVAEGPPDAPWIARGAGRARRGGAAGRAAAGRRGAGPGRPPPTSTRPRRWRPRTGRR